MLQPSAACARHLERLADKPHQRGGLALGSHGEWDMAWWRHRHGAVTRLQRLSRQQSGEFRMKRRLDLRRDKQRDLLKAACPADLIHGLA